MSKTISLIVGFLAIGTVVYSFLGSSDTGRIFGIEMNIWIYRLIWSAFAVYMFYDFSIKKKSDNNS